MIKCTVGNLEIALAISVDVIRGNKEVDWPRSNNAVPVPVAQQLIVIDVEEVIGISYVEADLFYADSRKSVVI
ncbi:hypothetical protein D3C77_748420 [compost metagenome]